MNLDRREFLQVSAAAGLLVALPVAHAAHARVVVAETGSAEADRFARTLNGERLGAGLDSGPLIQRVTERWRSAPVIVAGLTSDTTFVVLDAVLSSLGADLALEGTHRFVAGRWQHRVQASPTVQRRLAPALDGGGEDWPALVAYAADRALPATRGPAVECISGVCTAGRPARDHLVSWMFVPRATARTI